MERSILVNQIMTPDGTILESHHRHDYKTHIDKNGLEYMVDGGMDYLRRNIHKDAPYKEMTICEDSPYEEIRKYVKRGGRGINGDEPLAHVALKDMNDGWLAATISWEKANRPDNDYIKLYEFEVIYRKNMNIKVD